MIFIYRIRGATDRSSKLIALIYIFFLLGAVYLLATANAVIGVFKGRAVSQDCWHRLVLWFDLHSFR
jgi:hypothetical protein